MDTAIELVDLALDFTLAERQRDGQQDIRTCGPHGRGSEHVAEYADRVLPDKARKALQDDRAVDIVWGSRREHAGGKEGAL